MTVKALDFTTKERLKELVEDWTVDLCLALEQNYLDYHKRMVSGNYERYNGVRSDLSDYAKEQLDAIENGTANLMYFKVNTGKKYYKIVQMEFDTFQDRNEYRAGSVHAFVDKQTGQVYKPASWQAPAKHVRFDLRIIKEREFLFNSNNTGWAGGYLYLR